MSTDFTDRQPVDAGKGFPMLRLVDVSVQFGGVVVLDDISLDVSAGECVGLIGPNGAGKSTCVNAIAGLVRATGVIRLAGANLARVRPHRRARLGLGRTFQNLELFPALTVYENISLAASKKLTVPVVPHYERTARAEDALRALDLWKLRDRHVSTLPYGTKKLVELARVLTAQPKMLLLDEPMAGLDSKEKQAFISILSRTFTENNYAVLLIEHDMTAIESLSDRVHVLTAGRTIATGTFAEVTSNPEVLESYIGA